MAKMLTSQWFACVGCFYSTFAANEHLLPSLFLFLVLLNNLNSFGFWFYFSLQRVELVYFSFSFFFALLVSNPNDLHLDIYRDALFFDPVLFISNSLNFTHFF